VGDVLVAQHPGLGAQVALKFLQSDYVTVGDAAVKFAEAARKHMTMSSDHVARVYDVDAHEGVPFLVMEELGQQHLRALLQRRETLDHHTAVDIVLQICEALATAHALSVVHSNIKPENIFLLGEDNIKVVDFGISARALALEEAPWAEASKRISHVRFAAQPYLAPEQIRGSVAGDVRTDIWSMGCLLFELLTGKSPFDRGNLMATCVAILESDPVGPHGIPEGLRHVIVRCLRKHAEARFADVAALAEALAPFGTERYRHYPERCRARLCGTPSECSNLADASVAPVPEADTAASTPVSVIRTLVLAPAATPVPQHDLSAEPPPPSATAAPVHNARNSPRVSVAWIVAAVLCALGVGIFGVEVIARAPAQPPRLLHLVTPAPHHELPASADQPAFEQGDSEHRGSQ